MVPAQIKGKHESFGYSKGVNTPELNTPKMPDDVKAQLERQSLAEAGGVAGGDAPPGTFEEAAAQQASLPGRGRASAAYAAAAKKYEAAGDL